MKTLHDMIKEFYPYAKERMGFDRPVRVVLRHDENNASKMLGKTAYYTPSEDKVVLYVSGRHPKDVMRSFSHELVHHKQNQNGELNGNAEEGADGSPIENDANAKAGEIVRKFGKIKPEIYDL